jgi:hypothetical protein
LQIRDNEHIMNRRNFVQTAVAGTLASSVSNAASSEKMIGIQVGAVSFVDEGVPKVLDIFQQSAYINTLFVATFTYGRGIAGRQIPGQPLPDHGKQEYDTDAFKGGSYTKVHPQYYKIQDFRAPDFGDYDVLEAVLPEARKRGIKTICWFEDVWESKSRPAGTRDAVAAALRAGADGVLLSRKYSEIKLANLRGAGVAIKAAGLA